MSLRKRDRRLKNCSYPERKQPEASSTSNISTRSNYWNRTNGYLEQFKQKKYKTLHDYHNINTKANSMGDHNDYELYFAFAVYNMCSAMARHYLVQSCFSLNLTAKQSYGDHAALLFNR